MTAMTPPITAVAWPVPVPESRRQGSFTLLTHLRERDVFVPWLHIVNAVLSEFAIGVWAATYLKEVGHASGGQASALAGVSRRRASIAISRAIASGGNT